MTTLSAVGPVGILIDDSLLTLPANQQPTCTTAGTALPSYLTIGTLYSFVNAGDQIPQHTHTDSNNHYSIVLAGSVNYVVQNADGSTTTTALSQGAVLLVPNNVSHSFVALTASAVVLNLRAAGFTLSYLQSSIADFQTQVTAMTTALNALMASAAAAAAANA